MKYPRENKSCDDVIRGEPNKSGSKRGNHESQNPYTIDDGNQSDESIFNVVHGLAI